MGDERCFLCAFWDGEHETCNLRWRMVFLIKPTGGLADFQVIPGMVPEEFHEELSAYFAKLMERMTEVIELMPVWKKIRAYQQASPERAACPGRKVREDIKPYLRIVKK
ncbi:MAG: hypothetical protein JRI66_12300 [Deltaproteobacteria bacterium]|nr:hypothetical protein [Deltaproteobacteria bacterium]